MSKDVMLRVHPGGGKSTQGKQFQQVSSKKLKTILKPPGAGDGRCHALHTREVRSGLVQTVPDRYTESDLTEHARPGKLVQHPDLSHTESRSLHPERWPSGLRRTLGKRV